MLWAAANPETQRRPITEANIADFIPTEPACPRRLRMRMSVSVSWQPPIIGHSKKVCMLGSGPACQDRSNESSYGCVGPRGQLFRPAEQQAAASNDLARRSEKRSRNQPRKVSA